MFIQVLCIFLDEIDVGGPKIVYGHSRVGNVRAKIPKDQPKVLVEGPNKGSKAALGSPTYYWQSTASIQVGTP